ncbi:MAG TPA: hypothetical protein VKP11_00505 [Frankiaceae bacterium]|nr:hypothetical protein [Frankiaceae bacterium]
MAIQTFQRRREGDRPESGGAPVRSTVRAALQERTFRADRWWVAPAVTVVVLLGFTGYGIWAGFRDANYYADPYLSPFYSPCLTEKCVNDPALHVLGDWWAFSPALLILPFPLFFRVSCYYYRKAYYRSFFWAPPACAVPDSRRRYKGESRFPFTLQNLHRYFFYAAAVLVVIFVYESVKAFIFDGRFGIGVGTGVIVLNTVLLGLYTFSCHSCRHLCGGRLNHFSKHPVRYRLWRGVSVINRRHMLWAWLSLIWLMVTDFYIWLVATGHITDYHWVS